MSELPNFTDPDLYLGTVVSVSPSGLTVNLPFAAAASLRRVQGRVRLGGLVGDFVCIDAEGWVILGRLDEVRLPERDRALVDPRRRSELSTEPHPIGRIVLLASIRVTTGQVMTGADRPVRLGARVYLAPGSIVELAASATSETEGAVHLRLGHQPFASGAAVRFSPEALFDRHCAVVGSTGGGKSWTTSRILEEVADAGGKALLVDPTGEYRPPSGVTRTVRLGTADSSTALVGKQVVLPYWTLSSEDLFALFTPAGQVQGPLLREALSSLRLVAVLDPVPDDVVVDNGTLVKEEQKKRPVTEAIRANKAYVEAARGSYFEIEHLVTQLKRECVWQTSRRDPHSWGGPDDKNLGYVLPLALRIESFLSDSRFGCVFRATIDDVALTAAIDDFLADGDARILHVDVSTLPVERNFRQIVVNGLARLLLEQARDGCFQEEPLLVFVDEAHHFLGRIPHLDDFGLALDGIELIAKEGRKYGLHLVLATQRPRDLTRPVLSQIGTAFVHRMTEAEDLEVLANTAGRRDLGSAAYVPTLLPGECLLFGAAVPFPLVVKIDAPTSPPISSGSAFSSRWTSGRVDPDSLAHERGVGSSTAGGPTD